MMSIRDKDCLFRIDATSYLRLTLSLIFILIVLIAGCNALVMPKSKITVIVVDEDAKPVAGARVSMTFEVLGGNNRATINGLTDKKGVFVASHKSTNSLGFSVQKDNYYESGGGYHFETSSNGKWQPWNPESKVILRKIVKPVPMYARSTQMSKLIIPIENKPIGFDLIEYDWVAPYGHGQISDFIFRLERNFVDDHHFNCKLFINFSNKYDGIQQIKNEYSHSMFNLPRNAPETGYDSSLTRVFTSEHDPTDKSLNFIFRVRSEMSGSKLARAMYGKIYGDIEFDPKGKNTASILFDYYLNPDYTNNLEFDPKQNLFTNIKSYEGLSRP